MVGLYFELTHDLPRMFVFLQSIPACERTICSVNFNERKSFGWLDLETSINYDSVLYSDARNIKHLSNLIGTEIINLLWNGFEKLDVYFSKEDIKWILMEAHRLDSAEKPVKASWRLYINCVYENMFEFSKFLLYCIEITPKFSIAINEHHSFSSTWSDLIDFSIYPSTSGSAPQLNRAYGQYKPGDTESIWQFSNSNVMTTSNKCDLFLFKICWVNDLSVWDTMFLDCSNLNIPAISNSVSPAKIKRSSEKVSNIICIHFVFEKYVNLIDIV